MSAAILPATGTGPVANQKDVGTKADDRRSHPRRRSATSGPGSSEEDPGVVSTETLRRTQRDRHDEPLLVLANAGDHATIYQFLTVVFQGPSHDMFLASLDDPFYEPSDRLLIKRGHQILAHLHLTRRVMRYGSCRFPASGLDWLGTLPEFRGQGFASRLMQTADRLMIEEGSQIAWMRTSIPHYFRRFGWAVCGRHCHTRVSTRDLLSHLSSSQGRRRTKALSVRPWRQVELPALMRLYQENVGNAVGAYERTEAYWRWLISRKGFDQILVAFEGPDKFDPGESDDAIVGYAVTWQDRILELMTTPTHSGAAKTLMARACHEAIERDYHVITLHGPPDDPRHKWIADAGGSPYYHESDNGDVFMVKLLDPFGMLRTLGPELKRRADEAGLPLPCELGLLVEGQRYRLLVNRRTAKISRQKLGRSYLTCNSNELTRLIMGHVDVAEAADSGRLEASTRVALETASALFPRLPLWRSPVDDLVA